MTRKKKKKKKTKKMNKSSINNNKKNFLVKEKNRGRERKIIKVITITNKKKIHRPCVYDRKKKDPTTTRNLKRIKK